MMCQNMHVILVFIISSLIPHFAKCEFFTAIADMEVLLQTEGKIAETLEKYLKVEEERLEKIRRLSQKYSRLNSFAIKDEEIFLSNPVNAYLLVKRLTTDWEITDNLLRNDESRAIIDHMRDEVSFPTHEDLSGAGTALVRLQKMYYLNTTAIASGRIKGAPPSEELSAAECFDLGLQAYAIPRYDLSFAWMKEALERLKKEDPPSIDMIRVMEYISYSAHGMKKYKTALTYAEELMALFPNYTRGALGLKYYQNYVKDFGEDGTDHEKKAVTEMPSFENWPEEFLHPYIIQSYEKLCRGESMKTPEDESQLYCYHTTNNNSYLLLQPIKVEVLNIKPRFLMYHDMISDKEADIIKNMSLPMLEMSTVSNGKTGELKNANYRISKSAWLSYSDHPIVTKICQRIQDVTGLDYYFAEPLHVLNYGIGGYYDTHYDFLQKGQKNPLFEVIGNRIATWIFYLSDVPAGGSTVFPRLGVEVKPVKGAAAFWYNLHQNGNGDTKMIHGACPVLVGSKWVANLWLHEHGNEFTRPCSLDPSE